jgi:hypothetical protein
MSISNDRRPSARLGDVEFAFEQPQLDSAGQGKAVKHEVIPLDENDDSATVIQPMGRRARDWTLRGTCYEDTATTLDDMVGEVVGLRHSRHSGDVYIDDVSTNPQGVEDDDGWRYDYTVALTEVV